MPNSTTTTWAFAEMADAFNEWMRRYTEEPERFEREWQSVERYHADQDGGREPSYGRTCAAFLYKLADKTVVVVDEPPGPPLPRVVT